MASQQGMGLQVACACSSGRSSPPLRVCMVLSMPPSNPSPACSVLLPTMLAFCPPGLPREGNRGHPRTGLDYNCSALGSAGASGQSGHGAGLVKLFRKLPEGAHRFQGGACVRHMESVTTGPHLAPVSRLGTRSWLGPSYGGACAWSPQCLSLSLLTETGARA